MTKPSESGMGANFSDLKVSFAVLNLSGKDRVN